jgi:hypothetical protein
MKNQNSITIEIKINLPEGFENICFYNYNKDNPQKDTEGSYYQDLRAIARDMKESGATINEIMEKTGLAKGTVSNYTKDITRKKGRSESN